MKIRKTHPGDTTSISIDSMELDILLKNGFVRDGDAKLALTDVAKEFLVKRDTDIFKQGEMSNEEVQEFVGRINCAIGVIKETAIDYTRLAKDVSGEDPRTAFEFACKSEGLCEALNHILNILTENSDVKQD